jgi:glycogen operon protein
VGVLFDGAAEPDRDPRGRPLVDDDLLLLVNAWWDELSFTVPDGDWRTVVDTYTGTAHTGPAAEVAAAGPVVTVGPRSLVLLVCPQRDEPGSIEGPSTRTPALGIGGAPNG